MNSQRKKRKNLFCFLAIMVMFFTAIVGCDGGDGSDDGVTEPQPQALSDGTYNLNETWYTFNEDGTLDFDGEGLTQGSWSYDGESFTMYRHSEIDILFEGNIVPLISTVNETYNTAFTLEFTNSLYIGAYKKIFGDESTIVGTYSYNYEKDSVYYDGTSGKTFNNVETITKTLTYNIDYTWELTQIRTQTDQEDEITTGSGTWQADGMISLVRFNGFMYLINADTEPYIRQ